MKTKKKKILPSPPPIKPANQYNCDDCGKSPAWPSSTTGIDGIFCDPCFEKRLIEQLNK